MTFYSRPDLDDRAFKQLVNSILTMNGTTDFVGTLKSKGIEIDATAGGGDVGKVLTLVSGDKIGLSTISVGSSGEYIAKTITKNSHGFIVGDVIGWDNNLNTYVKDLAVTGATETLGVVLEVPDVNTFKIIFSGYVFIPNNISTDSGTILSNKKYYLSPTNSGKLTLTEPTSVGDVSRPVLLTTSTVSGSSIGSIVFQYNPEIIYGEVSSVGQIGNPETGTGYTNGYYTDLEPTMRAGIPVDRFNQLFKLLLPQPAPSLDSVNSTSSFINAKLSFGASKNDIGYENVTTAAGNSAIDINGLYSASGTRLGVINGNISGIINNDVVGDVSGIPYENYAIGNGYVGLFEIKLNGITVNIVDFSATSGAINNTVNNTTLNFSALKNVKLDNGNDVEGNYYRTGTYTINTAAMSDGFNYMILEHVVNTTTYQSNYLEWVYDADSNNISFTSFAINTVNLSGSKHISGVEYNTSGSVDVQAAVNNVYRNIFRNGTAISYPTRTNLGTQTSISVTGSGINSGTSTSLPNLRTDVSNPEATSINIASTLPINTTRVLGTLGSLGSLALNNTVQHAFSSKTATSSSVNETGFLFYNVTQSSNLELENFTGEINRLEARDYSLLTYAAINGGTYAWSSTQDLISGDAQHNTGLLVFDGNLLYPNTTYLTSTYGITAGNFDSLTYSPTSNANYNAASGIRDYYRLFKSNNTTTQSTLTFEITNSGTDSNFLTNGGTGGTPSGNNIKFEFLIKRSNGNTHGWANPFASTGNPEGIAKTSSSHAGGVTTVTCTLSVIPKVGNGDIVVVRVFAASGWTNRISEITITNI
jgi:hypothetical protein